MTWVILSESVREAFLEEVSLKHLAASDNSHLISPFGVNVGNTLCVIEKFFYLAFQFMVILCLMLREGSNEEAVCCNSNLKIVMS